MHMKKEKLTINNYKRRAYDSGGPIDPPKRAQYTSLNRPSDANNIAMEALKAGEISRVTPIAGSFYVVTFILGVLLLGENISWLKCAGIGLVTLGIWMLRIA